MGLREAFDALSNGGDEHISPEEFDRLREDVRSERWDNDRLKESLYALELAIDEEGWRRFGARMQQEFNRSSLDRLIESSQGMYMANPLIKRAVNVKTYYTWGQGIDVQARDQRVQDDVIEPLMSDDGNRAEYYSHQSRLLTDVDQQTEGNVFFRMPTSMLGEVTLRSIPTREIINIHTKPGDPMQVWFYHRVWTELEFDMATGNTKMTAHEALYPDYRYQPVNKPRKIGNYVVLWEEPIIHQRTGGTKHMRFGVPELYSTLDWARAYKRFLEDWHTLVKSLAKFAWRRVTTGERRDAEKAKFDAMAPEQAEMTEPPLDRLRANQAGGVFLDVPGGEMTPIPKAGATPNADEGRVTRMMIASGSDLPDTILSGDVDVGNFATSKTLDRPTELAMTNRQLMWKDFDQAIFQYAVEAKIRRGLLPGRVEYVGYGLTKVHSEINDDIHVSYPPVLEHDVKDMVTAIVSAATLAGNTDAGTIPRERTSRALGEALGFDDLDEMIRELTEEQKSELNRVTQELADKTKELTQPQPGDNQPGENPPSDQGGEQQ